MQTRTTALLVALVLAVAACGGNGNGDDAEPTTTTTPETTTTTLPPGTSLVAHVRADLPEVTPVDAPGSDTPVPDATLANPRLINDGEAEVPLVLLVRERADDGWLEVLLPIRPNGTTGWIHESDVDLREVPYRLEVDLSGYHMTLFRNDEVVLESAVGLGGDGEPTPPGTFFVTELLQPPNPGGAYGPYAYGLSGFSDIHFEFGGGDGQIGLHGTNDPSSIGIASSAGCIRLPNEVIEELAAMLPLGTPVEILA